MVIENSYKLEFIFKKNQWDTAILKGLAEFINEKIERIEDILFSSQKIQKYIFYIEKQKVYTTQQSIISNGKEFPYFLQITSLNDLSIY